MAKAPVLHTGDRGFESLIVHHARLAQLEERLDDSQEVVGSIPAPSTSVAGAMPLSSHRKVQPALKRVLTRVGTAGGVHGSSSIQQHLEELILVGSRRLKSGRASRRFDSPDALCGFESRLLRMEGWQSGQMHSLRKREGREVSGVRIPHLPPRHAPEAQSDERRVSTPRVAGSTPVRGSLSCVCPGRAAARAIQVCREERPRKLTLNPLCLSA